MDMESTTAVSAEIYLGSITSKENIGCRLYRSLITAVSAEISLGSITSTENIGCGLDMESMVTMEKTWHR